MENLYQRYWSIRTANPKQMPAPMGHANSNHISCYDEWKKALNRSYLYIPVAKPISVGQCKCFEQRYDDPSQMMSSSFGNVHCTKRRILAKTWL